jgi:NAD(P)-dependent dehydrogenase (short-subunit alcohol dehydrogenase family)
MAGLATDLGPIEASGYTMAKWGVVALTRSFGTAKPNLSQTEDVKCFALLPYFVDTKLVRDVLDVTKIEKMFGYRAFSVSEIGDYFDLALKLDSNGACYGLMPDFPMLDIPNANKIVFVTYGLIGKLLQPLGVTSIGTPVVIATIVLFALLLFMLLSVIF